MFFMILVLSTLLGTEAFAAETLKTPRISANTLFLYRNSNYHQEDANATSPDQEQNGLGLREAELQFDADVDPYNRLNLVLAVHPEYSGSGTKVEEKWKVEPEEAFAESNLIPDVTLRLGKFKAAMGKHNQLHTHAFALVDAPLANKLLLGDEGLNDVGVSAAGLLPTSWFSEVTLQFLRGAGENAEFSSPSPSDGVGLARWKNLLDLTEDLTLEAGLSGAQGANSLRGVTSLAGADLTFKWRPADGGRSRSWAWTTETLNRAQSQPGVINEKGDGLASWFRYQFAERWATVYRFDRLRVTDSFDPAALPNDTWERSALALVFTPSEFSAFHLQYGQSRGGLAGPNGETTEKSIFLQANFSIGAHPAHAY